MKTRIQSLLLALACTGLLSTPAMAQTANALHSFSSVGGFFQINGDGAYPRAGLVLSSNTLYGTAEYGGANGNGSVFAVSATNGSFSVLHHFSAFTTGVANNDGAYPLAGLILSSNILYGTTSDGGTNGNGTVFAVNIVTSNLTVLHTFSALSTNNQNFDGVNPQGGLVLSGNTLYGTTVSGSSNRVGTVFAVTTSGSFSVLYSFSRLDVGTLTTNSDGAQPLAGLILSGNTLYGTTSDGGTNGNGTVFALNIVTSNLTVLHTFSALDVATKTTNYDGANPEADLVLAGNTLYGTAVNGGAYGNGTVFAVTTNGGFSLLHAFTTADGSGRNSDGVNPLAGLVLSSNLLYGTTQYGGTNGNGTVFAVTASNGNYSVLHHFTAFGAGITNLEGANPLAGLVLSGNTLYGTASAGGATDNGTVFSFTFASISPPLLAINPSGTNVILTWPTNATGFTLESTTNLMAPAVWITNATAPAIVNTNNAVTNGITGTQKFYRLSQ